MNPPLDPQELADAVAADEQIKRIDLQIEDSLDAEKKRIAAARSAHAEAAKILKDLRDQRRELSRIINVQRHRVLVRRNSALQRPSARYHRLTARRRRRVMAIAEDLTLRKMREHYKHMNKQHARARTSVWDPATAPPSPSTP